MLDHLELALWPHQRAAVEKAQAYFDADVAEGCLIHMPTGTGKTGVMATTASLRAAERPVLVVCPSAALAEQLIGQLSARFWEKIGAPAGWVPDHVHHLLPSTISSLAPQIAAADAGKTILVATIQGVQQAYSAGQLEPLFGLVGTILFDEGHREPAPAWARVIRAFAVPTLLFSATPFRGDLRIFNVHDDFIHFLSFDEAVSKHLVRGVEIDERDLSPDAAVFAQQLVARVDQLVAEGRFAPHHKMIVRCASEAHVASVYYGLVDALAGRDDGVLALHDTFKKTGGGQLDSVPRDLSARTERFLVHQFMLIEGIDDPNCTMLALYDPFQNTRMLVQQVGRLIRHPGPIGDAVPRAYVLAPSGSQVAVDWQSFLTFDKAAKDNGGKPYIRNDDKVLKALLEALPILDYVGGKFRPRVDFDDREGTSKDLRFPSAATAFSVAPDLDMDALQTAIEEALDADDRHIAFSGEVLDGACRYQISLRLTPSPFLSGNLFHAPSLEATIYTKCDGRLFFYDSAGLWINDLDLVGPRIASVHLRSLLPEGDDNFISFVAVKNSDLGPLALRSRSMSARSLAHSGIFMGEHLNIVTRAVGSIEREKRTHRAVGFSRARIRDGKGTDLSAEEYGEWCVEVASELDAAAQSAAVFERFAAPVDPPENKTPVNILIDMIEIGGQFLSSEQPGGDIEIEDLCVAIEPDDSAKAPASHKFKLRVDGIEHDVWIKWVPKKRRYWLVSPGLSAIKSKEDAKVSLTSRLNLRQPFRILLQGMKHSYVSGDFYKLDLDLTDPNGPAKAVLSLITPISGLGKIVSEKGELQKGHFPGWDQNSLFHFIDEALRADKASSALGPAFPHVVCDDLQTEVGDFIALDDKAGTARATIVAAKSKKGTPSVSASAFYDVCAQGVKNLAFMKSDGTDLPGKETRYDTRWKLTKNKTDITQTVDRRRCGLKSQPFRKKFVEMRASPSTERALWLVCSGGMLSLKKLKQEFHQTPPDAHVLQFYHLVMSTYSACQSVGVKLKIFCAD